MKRIKQGLSDVAKALGATWRDRRGRAVIYSAFILSLVWVAVDVVYPAFFRWYTGDKVASVDYPNSREVSDGEFEELARQIQQEYMLPEAVKAAEDVTDPTTREDRIRLLLKTESFVNRACFRHIDTFREHGIREYKGPETCLSCHPQIRVDDGHGNFHDVDTMADVLDTVHYNLFVTREGFSTYGYNGERVNSGWYKIPVGKIDRACGIPGSFTWTGWADLITAKPLHGGTTMLSAGCGQCHIGGMYGPPSEAMMPGLKTPKQAQAAVDCLICHSVTYDMNQKYVIDDGVGKRWNQDRSMKAAMGVTKPHSRMCLRCHQHNMGGDAYEMNEAAGMLGYRNKRIIHDTAKRATPYGPDWDVHAKAGMDCLDCHTNRGHKIARGTLGVDLVANDLPGVEVSCERCHTAAPHVRNKKTRAMLNGHVARVSCEACHITKLHKTNLVMVDWVNPVFNEEEGIFVPRPVKVTGDLKQAVEYMWLNGNGTFLANALGANPNNAGLYDPLMEQLAIYKKDPNLHLNLPEDNSFISQLSPELLAQRRRMIDQNLRPVMESGISKIYPLKLFNAFMFEDMNNKGPFGAMILPFDYKIYHEQGKPYESMKKAVSHPIVRRMYQPLFKYYMMDKFMEYFGVGEWSTKYPLDPENEKAIKPQWMRQMGSLMMNHAIDAKGHDCITCHAKDGLLDFRALGYTEERSKELENPPELKEYGLDQPTAETDQQSEGRGGEGPARPGQSIPDYLFTPRRVLPPVTPTVPPVTYPDAKMPAPAHE